MSGHHVLVIGGGGTGAAIIHDLTQRGYRATVVERGELTAGTTGGCTQEQDTPSRMPRLPASVSKRCELCRRSLRKRSK